MTRVPTGMSSRIKSSPFGMIRGAESLSIYTIDSCVFLRSASAMVYSSEVFGYKYFYAAFIEENTFTDRLECSFIRFGDRVVESLHLTGQPKAFVDRQSGRFFTRNVSLQLILLIKSDHGGDYRLNRPHIKFRVNIREI